MKLLFHLLDRKYSLEKKVIIIRSRSIAKKNVIILILSLLPFIVGLSYSIYRNSDRNYLSRAINIAGSQRMRTILIANYAHQIYDQGFKSNEKIIPLINELRIYKEYTEALKYGNTSLDIKANNFLNIKNKLENLTPLIDDYIKNVNNLIYYSNQNNKIKKTLREDLQSILINSIIIKDEFHNITEQYQYSNDLYIQKQKTIDEIMIFLAIGITIIGLFLTTKIKQQEYHANFDSLTKLKNRHSLFSYIEDKSPVNFSIYFIDLNKFKIINDTYGHEIGDEILIGVSKKLLKVFGEDNLYRYGGDEFIALTKSINKIDVNQNIDRNINTIKELLSEPLIDSYDREHFIGMAIGVVSSNVAINKWDILINLSDDLMYESKSIIGNTVILRNKKDLKYHINFLKDIDDVIYKGALKLHYQPVYIASNIKNKISMVTSKLEKNGEEFYVSEFLHILKRKGSLIDLDKNTLQTLNSDYHNNITMNSPKNFNNRYIITLYEDTLINIKSNGILSLIEYLEIPRDKIIIKIQEKFLENKKIRESLEILKSMDFSFAIDDFTFDLSLKDFFKYKNIECFKIDNSMINTIFFHKYSIKILKEFINMIIKNNKFVILEGVNKNNLSFFIEDLSELEMKKIMYTNKFPKHSSNLVNSISEIFPNIIKN